MEISNDFFKCLRDEQLSDIAIKIGCQCIPGGGNREHYIEKIKERYINEYDKVTRWFESENEEILTNIKLYILDSSLELNNKVEIENVLLNWGIYNGYSLETTIAGMLREKYRAEFIKEGDQSGSREKYPLYIKMIMFLNDLTTISLKENEKDKMEFIEKFVKQNKEIGNSIFEYLIEERVIEQYYSKKSIKIKVDKKMINNLLHANNLLDFYKCYYKCTLEILGCSDWLDLIYKIGNLQEDNKIWLNNDMLQLIDLEYLKTMEDYGLIDETFIDGNKYISLTSLGLSVFNNEIIDSWPGIGYRLYEKDNIFIAYNDNPKVILNNLLENQLVCRENLLEFKLHSNKQHILYQV